MHNSPNRIHPTVSAIYLASIALDSPDRSRLVSSGEAAFPWFAALGSIAISHMGADTRDLRRIVLIAAPTSKGGCGHGHTVQHRNTRTTSSRHRQPICHSQN